MNEGLDQLREALKKLSNKDIETLMNLLNKLDTLIKPLIEKALINNSESPRSLKKRYNQIHNLYLDIRYIYVNSLKKKK
jgi:hypothetical protein